MFHHASIMASISSERFYNNNWIKIHKNHSFKVKQENINSIIIGDSIVAGLTRYTNIWNNLFGNFLFWYCLQLEKMIHISKSEFETLNWLPVKDRFNQSINSIVFKYFTKQCPSYLNEVFELACSNNLRTRNSYLKLICPFRKSNMGQNVLSFIGPSIWNKTPEVLKKTNSINTFKHDLKKYYLSRLS